VKNRSKNHKKAYRWHSKPDGWELHHIDRNSKNGNQSNHIMIPSEIHDEISKTHNSYKRGILPNNGGDSGKNHIPRSKCVQMLHTWMKRTRWTGIDPNTGDGWKNGQLVQKGQLF